MDEAQRQLAHALKIAFGLPPAGPTQSQLDAIVADVRQIQSSRLLTNDDWRKACEAHVPAAGTYRYRASDISDLTYLLSQLRR